MKTKILALLVIVSFAFFSCEKQDGVEQSNDLSDLQLKSASIAVNDIAVEGVTQEANYETDFYAGYEHLLRQLAHFKGGKGNLLHGHKGMHYVEGQSPLVSIDTAATGYPIVITIEYGDNTVTKKEEYLAELLKLKFQPKKVQMVVHVPFPTWVARLTLSESKAPVPRHSTAMIRSTVK